MSIEPGQQIAHYRVVEKIGRGGMGEVYRAEDTRLNRAVALKVLPPAFTADAERLARFGREARLLASLNHANIGHIYGLEEAEGLRCLVLELVEGETLAKRIARGPIPVPEALTLALEIARAVEAAHQQGIIHRDLKPANVMIAPGGGVKVLDFGLAKALGPESGSPLASVHANSPTLTQQATRAGTLIGTASYMSPEQARGLDADRRADIWALGVVLFEMLTGRMAFTGATLSDVLASVLKTGLDWSRLPAGLHPEVRRLLERCLEKDPDRRLHDVADARVILDDAVAGRLAKPETAAAANGARRMGPGWAGLAAAALVSAGLAAGIMWLARPSAPVPPLRKVSLMTDERSELAWISPDGQRVAYLSAGKLKVIDLKSLEPREVSGSENAEIAFWSPDSRWLGFGVGARLFKVPAGGGAATVVAQLPGRLRRGAGAAWLPDGRIVFTTGNTGLLEVSDHGGEPRPLLDPAEDEVDFHNPAALPGGRGVLYVVHRREGDSTPIEILADGRRVTALELEGQVGLVRGVAYSPTGHILYTRTEGVRGIWALPYSLEDLEPTGEPFLIAPDGKSPGVSRDGTLIYLHLIWGSRLGRYVWLDRSGQRLAEITEPADQYGATPSPDGGRLAVIVEGDIWVCDLQRDTRTRLTFNRGTRWVDWSPDGQSLVYSANSPDEGRHHLFLKAADGTGEARDLGEGDRPVFLPDGNGALFHKISPESNSDIWWLSPLDGEPAPLIQDRGAQYGAGVSPDGQWLAYGEESGPSEEVFLTRFPSLEGKWQVSSGGCDSFGWSRDGTRIFYWSNVRKDVMEVEVTTDPAVSLGKPTRLFEVSAQGRIDLFGPQDGERFLFREPVGDDTSRSKIVLVQSWFEEFRTP